MQPLTDRLYSLERKLMRECAGADADSLANRRLILREAFRSYGEECYQQGLTDGMRDTRDTQRLAEELAAREGGDG